MRNLLLILCTALLPVGVQARQRASSGVSGVIMLLQGDFMPGPGGPGGKSRPVARKIFFYAAAKFDQVVAEGEGGFYRKINTPLMGQTSSAQDGKFQLKLAPGTYTMMVEEKGKLYANGSDGTYVKPVLVEAGKFTQIKFNIDYQATW
ncbi:hypothetical protein IV102_11225 [bacterium]|nr:hypothetical protein [bacterium]